jgi:carbon monoxide dehydrogenase subunit G
MKLEGTYTFAAPRDVVWGALMDPEILARVMPGCDKLEQVGDNDYQGMIKFGYQ